MKDEIYEERPAGASLLCLKEIRTKETITYKYTGGTHKAASNQFSNNGLDL